MIGLGMSITTVAEFNRRARIALRAIDHGENFLIDMAIKLDAGETLTANQQQAFIRAVHRWRRQITDQMVKDYAAKHAREAD